ncbi:MAG TPA: heparin lyase I family protein [bacterium]|nr:heparin lyase I family protein [bacterium]HPN46084.1 heparin lyase I family protein [bacterium]
MNVYDGFESDQLSNIWNMEKILPGALQIQSTCVHTGKRAAKITLYRQTEDIRDRWLNFRFQIRFSRTPQGRIQAWLIDREIINYSGVTAYSQEYGYPTPSYFYFKMGLHRDQFTLPMTIYMTKRNRK